MNSQTKNDMLSLAVVAAGTLSILAMGTCYDHATGIHAPKPVAMPALPAAPRLEVPAVIKPIPTPTFAPKPRWCAERGITGEWTIVWYCPEGR